MTFRRCILVFTTVILSFISFSNIMAQKTIDERHIEVVLRMVGHELLLNAGDTTSRVLPIVREDDTYKVNFETEFGFNPESLVSTINGILKKTNISNRYIVGVEKCGTDETVYSYELTQQTEEPVGYCAMRDLPKDCYTIVFSLISSTDELHADQGPPENNNLLSNNTFLLSLAALMILAGIFLYTRKKNNGEQQRDAHIIPLGEYKFDKRNTELIRQNQRIELTNKEAELLILLYDAANTTVERDVILNMVWGDQGDYVGRTLDVFISKLRKKLEADSTVKIVNIRGIGYKLVMNN